MTMCNHDPAYRIDNEANGGTGCTICNREYRERHLPTLGKRIVMVQHRDGTREIDPTLMTMPEVLTGRAAAGLRNVAEMQREIGAAMKQAESIMANTMRSFEAYNKSQEEA